MLKNATAQEKFSILKPWIPSIIATIKKDLKNEHLKQDPRFAKKYFGNKQISKLTNEELAHGYTQAMEQEETPENLGEYLYNRWLLKNTDIYQFFEDKLQKIAPNFTEIVELEKNQSIILMEESIKHYGAPTTYLFCVINSVVFPSDVYGILKKQALDSKHRDEQDTQKHHEQMSVANIHTSYQQQIARLTDKYEKKLSGLERKYLNDTDAFKKQIAILQRKLNGQ